ncbi:flavin reductase family protein [Candidatus Acetothermia bacterium]|nr:flavin reductase family protein [Candidatus Acetothermia bacterium]
MIIEPAKLTATAQYLLMTDVVVPRPIAWVSSQDKNGVLNLAPFSFFNAISGSPPMVAISIGERHGRPKDTLANIQALGEFVVNIVDEANAEKMNLTSGDYPSEVDEFEVAKLTSAPSQVIRPPRVTEAAISLECRLVQAIPLPRSDSTLVIGEVILFHVRDELFNGDRVDASRLRPIARLGRSHYYTTLGRVFQMLRPKIP